MSFNFLFILVLFFPFITFSQEQQKNDLNEPYFNPVLLNEDGGNGTVLGLEYGYKKKWKFLEDTFDQNGFNQNLVDNQTSIKNGFVDFSVGGIWTNQDEFNPKSYSKSSLDIGYETSNLDFSLQYGFEGDQNYKNNQNSLLIQIDTFLGDPAKSYISTTLGYGEVDASNNDQRKTITDEEKFDRLNAELQLLYSIDVENTSKYFPKSLSFNYKYFNEIDAPQEIKNANLDLHKFGTIRLKFEKGVFIGYAKGKLPFDFDKKSVLEVGFTQNLF